MTIKEIITAMEYGCEIIKLFPGSAGPNYINAIKGPTVCFLNGNCVNLNNALSGLMLVLMLVLALEES